MPGIISNAGSNSTSVDRSWPNTSEFPSAFALPFSICCWASGALRLRPDLFFAVALLRIPRVAFYLWLIKIGLKDIS